MTPQPRRIHPVAFWLLMSFLAALGALACFIGYIKYAKSAIKDDAARVGHTADIRFSHGDLRSWPPKLMFDVLLQDTDDKCLGMKWEIGGEHSYKIESNHIMLEWVTIDQWERWSKLPVKTGPTKLWDVD